MIKVAEIVEITEERGRIILISVHKKGQRYRTPFTQGFMVRRGLNGPVIDERNRLENIPEIGEMIIGYVQKALREGELNYFSKWTLLSDWEALQKEHNMATRAGKP